jgi:hypothetical protein
MGNSAKKIKIALLNSRIGILPLKIKLLNPKRVEYNFTEGVQNRTIEHSEFLNIEEIN